MPTCCLEIKDDSAKQMVKGLSTSGNQYQEAIDRLCKRLDRPHFLHQTHVKALLDAPASKEGHGGELRRLNIVNQHFCALKAMDYDPPGHFITSMLELKLDQNNVSVAEA